MINASTVDIEQASSFRQPVTRVCLQASFLLPRSGAGRCQTSPVQPGGGHPYRHPHQPHPLTGDQCPLSIQPRGNSDGRGPGKQGGLQSQDHVSYSTRCDLRVTALNSIILNLISLLPLFLASDSSLPSLCVCVLLGTRCCRMKVRWSRLSVFAARPRGMSWRCTLCTWTMVRGGSHCGYHEGCCCSRTCTWLIPPAHPYCKVSFVSHFVHVSVCVQWVLTKAASSLQSTPPRPWPTPAPH